MDTDSFKCRIQLVPSNHPLMELQRNLFHRLTLNLTACLVLLSVHPVKLHVFNPDGCGLSGGSKCIGLSVQSELKLGRSAFGVCHRRA